MKRFAPFLVVLLAVACKPAGTAVWQVKELSFESSVDYSSSGADAIHMDVAFVHGKSGEKIVRPAFWDGGKTFLVRFAPTRTGKWK